MRNMCLREFIHYMIEVASGQLVNHEKMISENSPFLNQV